MTSSPLLVLVEIFAIFAAIFSVLVLCTVGLAVRRRHRRKTFSDLLRSRFSDQVQQVISVGDLLADPSLFASAREQMAATNEAWQARPPFTVSAQTIVSGAAAQGAAIPLAAQAPGPKELAKDSTIEPSAKIPVRIQPLGSQTSGAAQPLEPGSFEDNSFHDILRTRAWTGLITIMSSTVAIVVGAIVGVDYISRASGNESAVVAIFTVGIATIGTMTVAYIAIARVKDYFQSSSGYLDNRQREIPEQKDTLT
jgi:hypothetical protein